MKTNSRALLLIVLLSALVFSSMVSSTRLQHKLKSKKFQTISGREDPAAEAKVEKEIESIAENPAATAAESNLKKEGWMKIAVKFLRNKKKFPDMPMEDQDDVAVRYHGDGKTPKDDEQEVDLPATDATYDWRVNSKFGTVDTIPTETSFYFRLSGDNLFYSEDQGTMVVLGAISISNIKHVGTSAESELCFSMDENEKDGWLVCADTAEERADWVCQIKTLKGEPCTDEKPRIIEQKLVKQPIIYIDVPSPYCNENWNYGVHGKNWNCKCADGGLQSPINLPDKIDATDSGNDVVFDYHPQGRDQMDTPLKVYYEDNVLRIKGDFGKMYDTEFHHIAENEVEENIVTYQSHEIQIHTPAEHTINGETYDMEVQIHHKGVMKKDAKKKAVLSFLFKETAGVKNAFFEKIDLMDLPNPNKKVKILFKTTLDILDLITPKDQRKYWKPFSYYKYKGSLAAPPCEEETLWIIKASPAEVGTTGLKMLRNALGNPEEAAMNDEGDCEGEASVGADSELFANPEGNNRSTQPLNDRTVYFFDGDDCAPADDVKLDGHMEVFEKKTTDYFFVPGFKPSGLPNAFVVDEYEAKGIDPNQMHGQ